MANNPLPLMPPDLRQINSAFVIPNKLHIPAQHGHPFTRMKVV